MLRCSSELLLPFLILILIQVFSKRKASLLWEGAEGEDRSAGTTGEFAATAAAETKEGMMQRLGLLAGQSYARPLCLSSRSKFLGIKHSYMKLKHCCLGRWEGTGSSDAA